MTTLFKRILIVCCVALPSLAFAADSTPEAKPTAPQQTAAPAAVPTASPAPAEAAALKPAGAAQVTRIGSVDITRISTESERGKALKILLISKKDKLQDKIIGKKKHLDKLKASIEAKIASLTPPQREAKSKEFQKKVEEFQKFVQKSEEELNTLQEKESKVFYDAVEQAATEYGKTSGLAAIVVKKELLYVGSVDAQDVTDALIKVMNQAGQKK